MQNKTINELKSMWQENLLTEEYIQQLKTDPRKGVQRLVRVVEKSQVDKQILENSVKNMIQMERRYWNEGISYMAGVDEAGRGPLAGPVVAAAVILPKHFHLLGINDSKALSDSARDTFYEQII